MDFWNSIKTDKSSVIGGIVFLTMLAVSHFIVKDTVDTVTSSEQAEQKRTSLLIEKDHLIQVQKRLDELQNALRDLTVL